VEEGSRPSLAESPATSGLTSAATAIIAPPYAINPLPGVTAFDELHQAFECFTPPPVQNRVLNNSSTIFGFGMSLPQDFSEGISILLEPI
jgi:hypothetical protein